MCKTFKRFAAMGAAVMMMASISSMGASAADNTYSLYISNYGSVTSDTCETGPVSHNGYLNLSVTLKTVAKGSGITYIAYSGGSNIGGENNKISSTGTYSKKFTNSTKIRNGDRILVTVKLSPSPSGIGSSASGSVSGS